MSKTILTDVSGFTPVIDDVVDDVGIASAYVFGVVWRYCQMEQGACTASVSAIAKRCRMSRRSTVVHLERLVKAGYLVRIERQGQPALYYDTGLAAIRGQVVAGKVEEPEKEGVQNLQRGSAEFAEGGMQNLQRGYADSAEGGMQNLQTKIHIKDTNKRDIGAASAAPLSPEGEQTRTDDLSDNLPEQKPSVPSPTEGYKRRLLEALRQGVQEHMQRGYDLGFLPVALRPYGEAFLESAGVDYAPVRSDYSLWRKTINLWSERGYLPDDVIRAVRYMRAQGLVISSPHSITNIIPHVRAQKQDDMGIKDYDQEEIDELFG